MASDSNSALLIKAAKLIRTVPLDSELKMLLIELAVRMEDKRLVDLLKIVENFAQEEKKDENQLRKSLQNIKTKYERKSDQLVQEIDQELTKLEGVISEEEKEGKIDEVKKRIKEG